MTAVTPAAGNAATAPVPSVAVSTGGTPGAGSPGAGLVGGAGALVRRRRWPRRAAFGAVYGAAGLALLVPTSTAGASWYLAGQLLGVGGARTYPVRVHGYRDGLVTLGRTVDLDRGIPLGLVWPGGHAQLGRIVRRGRDTLVREVVEVTGGTLRPGLRAYTSARVFEGDPASTRGLPYSEVLIHGELGDLPAWLVPPTAPARDTWVIAVHGRGSSRAEVLRVLPVLAAAGLPTLAVTYRNDEGAPPSPDRCYHLGNTEWRDVAAAVRFARASGARDVILYGWSMGGAVVLSLLRQAPEAADVRAVVLDCPVVDWVATLRMHARALNLPPFWTWASMRLVQRRLGTALASLDHRPYARDLRVPTLLYVDHADGTVCPAPTLEYAALRPDLVTLVETQDAGHCRSWNRDPQGYEAQLAKFLAEVVED